MLHWSKRPLLLLALPFVLVGGLATATAAGWIVLPTEWSIAPPADLVVVTGTLPGSARLSADGAHLIVVEAGAGAPAIDVLDPATLGTQRRIDAKNLYGEPLPDAQGAGFWVGTGSDNTLIHVDADSGATDRTIALPKGFWPAAIAASPDGKTLAVSGDLVDIVLLIDAASGKTSEAVKVGRHPAGLVFAPDGKLLYVANWGERSVSIVDVGAASALDPIPVGDHPEKLLLSRDGAKLYVSETDDDAIGIIDLKSAKRIADVNIGLYDGKLYGASPTSLFLSPDGKRLYVICSAANAIVALDLAADGANARVIGAIGTGWYPTAATLDPTGRWLLVANAKGEGSPPNPGFDPYANRDPRYVSTITVGSVRRIPLPDDAALAAGIADVRAHGGPFLAKAIADERARIDGPPSDEPGRKIVAKGGPIKHVIYVIKENRTYDQVLGDELAADGDPLITLFGKQVTPNQHALAERFGLFDNVFADSFVSPDGHNWSTAAFANDYVEKFVPPNVGHRRLPYDFEDPASPAHPHSGYLWDDALQHRVSVRNYGEFMYEKPSASFTSHWRATNLLKITDDKYAGYNTDYSDLLREAEWAREFAQYVKNDNLPALEIIRLPNDHTSYTSKGKLTPDAMVAQNDLAFGRIVDAVSHSKYWASTAILTIEDDAQNGPDHVSAQRTTFYLASPYARGGVQHGRYSSAGVLRTIELILGLPPMTAYDASARPMYAAFGAKADLRPFNVRPAGIDLEARNGATSYRARDSAKLDLRDADEVPAALGNDILWHAVKGAAATSPPYGAFERR
jgi:YVTN family beta-propeller protein